MNSDILMCPYRKSVNYYAMDDGGAIVYESRVHAQFEKEVFEPCLLDNCAAFEDGKCRRTR